MMLRGAPVSLLKQREPGVNITRNIALAHGGDHPDGNNAVPD